MAPMYEQFGEQAVEWFITGGVRIPLILIGMFAVLFLLRRAAQKLRQFLQGTLPSPAQVKRAETLSTVLQDAARVAIFAIGTMMVLAEIGVDMKPLLAAAGIGGLAIGFANRLCDHGLSIHRHYHPYDCLPSQVLPRRSTCVRRTVAHIFPELSGPV